MNKKGMEFYSIITSELTNKGFLKKMQLSRKAMLETIGRSPLKAMALSTVQTLDFSCAQFPDLLQTTLNEFSKEPPQGWLPYIYSRGIYSLFPERRPADEPEDGDLQYEKGRFFLLQILKIFFKYEKAHTSFSPILHMSLLSHEEYEKYDTASEYARLLADIENGYVYEFMRVGAEITPFNTLGHIAGVHFTAMHVAKQLRALGVPVDLALVSGAAAGHDVGKYGCRQSEARRIPYLHYYYTDQCLRNHDMPLIAHIASNHSTWDLELENLSAESLILIYADFRVKSIRDENGKEIPQFYSLDDAFDVILGKLDNVDDKKKHRYEKVYAKLKDFEAYMENIGVSTILDNNTTRPSQYKPAALMSSNEVIDTLKYLAIEHNISVMNRFNSEAAFGNLLEAARSEKQWKSVRAYVNIFDEYSTYMTQKQKLMLLHFLYESLMHREGDIRRQSAALMGAVIAGFDEKYRKELPEGAKAREEDISSLELWNHYLNEIIFPDHKVTEQHRRWIGYTLKIVTDSLLAHTDSEEQLGYLNILLEYFNDTQLNDATAFILLDTMLSIPLNMVSAHEKKALMNFAAKLSARESIEIKIAALRFAEYATAACLEESQPDDIKGLVGHILDNTISEESTTAVTYLRQHVKINICVDQRNKAETNHALCSPHESATDIFLENLKVGTPWVIKAVNIEFLLENIKMGMKDEIFHIATHFSNLIKVSERVAVRHSAGKGLLAAAQLLSLDQRNEIVIELTKGLEIGEYQFSKYIPEYLGELSLLLHPNELDEFLKNLKELLDSSNDKVGSVTLDTLGIMVGEYHTYKERFPETEEAYKNRRSLMLGMLLRGLANYHTDVSQEAFWVIGQYIFGNPYLSAKEKRDIFAIIYKKMLTLVKDQEETDLAFFNNAAALNHIYRFISEYILENGNFSITENSKFAFFPGTFDPFSLSHKGIVDAIRALGFEVYLALDEFSWSKKTQPRMLRRQIITMSVADEENVYLFPDDTPVNIANSEDLKRLRLLASGRELYMVMGSDVILNASSYKGEASENSIHSFNHIVFRRESLAEGDNKSEDLSAAYAQINGNVIELKLPMHLEDISSTRIRENIDLNRDISNLIDPVAQNFIYDNSLYLREPQYKEVMQTKTLKYEIIEPGSSIPEELISLIAGAGTPIEKIMTHFMHPDIKVAIIRDKSYRNDMSERIIAAASIYHLNTLQIFDEFREQGIATYVRENASGNISIISSMYFNSHTEIRDLPQVLLTETLAECLKCDCTYAIYHPFDDNVVNDGIIGVLERQGFERITSINSQKSIYAVNMKFPITLFQNIESTLKDPFDRNEAVLSVIDSAHRNIQRALTKLYPGNLVLSFNSGIMHHKLVNMITKENGVPSEPLPVRKLGEYMCVPFGKILKGVAVPNTVTKTLHTEKTFNRDLTRFTIEEFPYYSPITNQVKTIKSFNRPVILVDDLLHKGYRMRELDPILKESGVSVSKIVVGILSGRGRDLMTIQGRDIDSAYFIPNLRVWFTESTMYPFIGGDSVRRDNLMDNGHLPAINLILPYAAPSFIRTAEKEDVYNFSMTCLENARDLLLVLEEQYQNIFERKLTLKRLGEAVISPRFPDKGACMHYDRNLAPSVYVSNDIEELIRIRSAIL